MTAAIVPALASAATISVPGDQPTIQGAINAATNGDTILVSSGKYDENVVINKALYLIGVNTGGGRPQVYASGSGGAITLTANGATVQGFNATHGEYGIYCSSNNNTIRDNVACFNSLHGIFIYSSDNNSVLENYVYNNTQDGIFVSYSSNCSVTGNEAWNHSYGANGYGLYFNVVSRCEVVSNLVYNNTNGIALAYADNCSMLANLARRSASLGFLLTALKDSRATANEAYNNSYGIQFTYSGNSNVTLTGNVASYNSYGMLLDHVDGSDAIANKANNNTNNGIGLGYSNGPNNLTGNTASNNGFHGYYLYNSGGWNLTGNYGRNNRNGVFVQTANGNNVTENLMENNTRNGIYLNQANGNNVSFNEVRYNGQNGLYFVSCTSGNNVSMNFVHDNVYGINLTSSGYGRLWSNTVQDSTIYGFTLTGATGNVIWLNYVVENGVNAVASSGGANNWNSSEALTYDYGSSTRTGRMGNAWDDYAGTDTNDDGIGETPYTIATNNVDNYPLATFSPAPGPVKNLRTGTMYQTIQAAICDAGTITNDVITVNSGTYKENVVVNKTLNLTGIDTGTGMPVVDGSGKVAINVTANGVTIRGFNATNGSTGIRVVSRYNVITDNRACNNTDTGIRVGLNYYPSSNNTVTNNVASNNTGWAGIELFNSSYCDITDNVVDNNSNGILLGVSSHCNVSGNTGRCNDAGLYILYGSDYTNVTGNAFNNNSRYGIQFYGSSYCNLTGNTVRNNTIYGVFLGSSAGNVFWLNTMAGNGANAYVEDALGNLWNSTSIRTYTYAGSPRSNYTGNYWGGYSGPDANADGIGDTAYTINGNNIDRYPMLTIAPVPPTAGFTANLTSGATPLTIQFTDTSTGNPTGWQWNFGDGNTSALQSPVHTYSTPGLYTVSLTASNGNGTNVYTQTGYISVSGPVIPVASFSANVTSGYAPLAVQFTDTSTGNPTGRAWSFGDGNSSTLQNPVNLYSTPGTYAVTLTASNGNGSDVETRSGYISVTERPVPVVAGFTQNVTTGVAPLYVQFNDTSSGNPTGWQWSFGDFTANSTERNATHTFETAGVFYVTLTVTNGSGSSQAKHWVSVTPPSPETYTIHLKQGWNLVSFPLVNFTLKSSDLNGTGILVVAAYNKTTGGYDMYVDGFSDIAYDVTMRTDISYFIYCTRDTILDVMGPGPSGRSTTINRGWNLIGWSSFYSNDAKSVCSMLSGMQIVARYNADNGGYDMYIEDFSQDSYNFMMRDGVGYYLFTDSTVPQTLYFEEA